MSVNAHRLNIATKNLSRALADGSPLESAARRMLEADDTLRFTTPELFAPAKVLRNAKA